MKRILVPTDLTETAEHGLRLAVEIAKRTGAGIFLINFMRHPVDWAFSVMGEASAKADQETDLFNIELLRANQAKLSEAAKHYAQQGVTIHTQIIDDELKDGVDRYLQDHAIDLMVMGTSGEENLKEQFTGNHTGQVIRISSCPVISVREAFDLSRFDNIVLVVNAAADAEPELYAGMQILKTLADGFDSTIHLVHVADPFIRMPYDLENHFEKLAKQLLFRKFEVAVLVDKDEAGTIMHYSERIRAGLIALFRSSRDEGLFRIFSDNFSSHMIKNVEMPVFTCNLQHGRP